MKISIRGATARSDQPSLCLSCVSRMYYKDDNGRELRYCSRLYYDGAAHQVPPRVVECSMYSDASLPSMLEMKQAAWILRTERSGSKIGFTPSLSAREREKYDEWDPEEDF